MERDRTLLLIWLVTGIAILGVLVVAGSAITVVTTTIETFSAEAVDVTGAWNITNPNILVVTAAEAGAATSNVEATSANPVARTALTKNNWMYKVTIQESAADSVTSGSFKAQLFVDGTLSGEVTFQQATSDSLAIEGVTAKFDLGANLPTGERVYVIKVLQTAA